jgi:hypothetical protein
MLQRAWFLIFTEIKQGDAGPGIIFSVAGGRPDLTGLQMAAAGLAIPFNSP